MQRVFSRKNCANGGDPRDFAADNYRPGVGESLYMGIAAILYNRNNLSAIVRRTTDDTFIPSLWAAACAVRTMCGAFFRWGGQGGHQG